MSGSFQKTPISVEGPARFAWVARGVRLLFSSHGAYYAAMVIAGGVGLLKSVAYGVILAPQDYGQLSLILSLVPFLVYGFGRGAVEGAALDLPRLYGLGRAEEAALLLRRCAKRLVLEGLVATAVTAVVFLADQRAAALCLAVPLAVSAGILALVMSDARSRGAMNLYGTSVLVRAIACLTLGLPAAAVFGFGGAVLGEVIAQFALIGWLFRYIAPASSVAQAGSSVDIRARGWKMMQHQFMQLLQQNGDKWIVSAALGPAMLGQYSFAGIFIVAVSLLHAIIYQQIGPTTLRALAEGKSLSMLYRRYQLVAITAGVAVAILGICTGIMYWFGLRTVFAPYALGFGIYPWVVLAGVCQIMNQHDWIVSTGKHLGTLARFDVAATTVFFALAGTGWAMGWPLTYFAVLACATRGAALLAVVYLASVTRQEAAVSA